MAATVIINEWTSAGTITDKTSGTVRFKNANNATVDLVNPLVVPTSGQEYSFEKWLRLQITDAGGFTQLSDLEVYSDGSNGFGTGVKAWYAIEATFQAPVVPDESQDPPFFNGPSTGSPGDAMADLFGLTSGSPGSLGAGPFTDGSPAEHIGSFIVLVMEVETTASAGVTPSETLTFAYSEI
jgi:hypothetical protein